MLYGKTNLLLGTKTISKKMQSKEIEYTKLLVDNTTCQRRFHLVYEEGAEKQPHVQVVCPHCQAVVFSENNHDPVMLSREENLVKSPDGRESLMSECRFLNRSE